MSVLFPTALGLLALCAELFFREALALSTWSPDFVTVLLLWLGVTRGWAVGGVVAAAFIGVLTDAFVGSPLGVHMLHGILLVLLVGSFSDRVRFQSLPGRLLLGGAGGLVSLFLLVAVCRVFLGETAVGARLGTILLPRTAVVLIFMPLAFPLLEWSERLISRRKEVGFR